MPKLTIEFEEVSETSKPRDVEIVKTSDQELGFILWFDDNGHYIEDVTIGTPAYDVGLRQEGIGKTNYKVFAGPIEVFASQIEMT